MNRLALALVFLPLSAAAQMPADLHFRAIEGADIALDDWRGRPMLVVNTASMCAYVGQYDELQALSDTYEDLVVLAVPSDDFKQELATGADVANFCAMNFDLTIPITDITPVTGPSAHPFYAWLKEERGFEPEWNFNKVLIGPDGTVEGTWGASVLPTGDDVTGRIEALLP